MCRDFKGAGCQVLGSKIPLWLQGEGNGGLVSWEACVGVPVKGMWPGASGGLGEGRCEDVQKRRPVD